MRIAEGVGSEWLGCANAFFVHEYFRRTRSDLHDRHGPQTHMSDRGARTDLSIAIRSLLRRRRGIIRLRLRRSSTRTVLSEDRLTFHGKYELAFARYAERHTASPGHVCNVLRRILFGGDLFDLALTNCSLRISSGIRGKLRLRTAWN